jgi:predicted dehydrogenase
LKTYKILIVGLGSIGRRHIKILKETIVCEISVLREKNKIPEMLPGVKEFLFSWEDIKNRNFDFAVICNPTSLHVRTAIALAKRGIPFLMEKPVYIDREQIAKLVHLVEEKKLPVLVGFYLRHHVLYKKIKEIIASAALGKLLSLSSEMGQYLPDWRAYDYRQSFSARKALGGGVIFELTHEIDLAIDLMGKVDFASCLKGKLSSLMIETEDVAEIILSHQDGLISHLHLDYLQKQYTRKVKLIFEKGEIFWDYSQGTLVITTQNKKREIRQPAHYTRDDIFKAQLKHWLQVFKGKREPAVSLENGIYVSDVAIAAHRSSDNKKWIRP